MLNLELEQQETKKQMKQLKGENVKLEASVHQTKAQLLKHQEDLAAREEKRHHQHQQLMSREAEKRKTAQNMSQEDVARVEERASSLQAELLEKDTALSLVQHQLRQLLQGGEEQTVEGVLKQQVRVIGLTEYVCCYCERCWVRLGVILFFFIATHCFIAGN